MILELHSNPFYGSLHTTVGSDGGMPILMASRTIRGWENRRNNALKPSTRILLYVFLYTNSQQLALRWEMPFGSTPWQHIAPAMGTEVKHYSPANL